MAPPKFSDFSKSVDDLLTNDFCFDRKVKLKTKAANSYELTPEFTLKSTGTVSAKLTGKFDLTKGITVNKLGVSDDGRYFADISYTDVLPNLSLTTLVEEGGKAPVLGEFGATYKHPLFVLAAKLDAINGPTLKSSLSAVVPHFEFLTLGAELKYNTLLDSKLPKPAGSKFGQVSDWTLGAVLTQKDLVFSAVLSKKCTEACFTLAQVVSPKTELAAKFTHGLKTQVKSLQVVGSQVIDSQTKVVAKMDNDGIVQTNVIQSVSERVKMISSFQIDAKSFSADSHKFGLQLQVA